MTVKPGTPAERVLLPGLSRATLAGELLAGITLLAIAVPLNIGYAQIAGLPATAGLYALVVPALVYAFVVSSRQLVASPDAAAAALVASSVGGLAAAGSDSYLAMALAQAIIGGIMLVLAGALRLGFLASFLSKPILLGFVGGLALDILVSQLAKMLGISIDSGAEFVTKLAQLITKANTLNPVSLLLATAAVAILLIGRRVARGVPWALTVLVLTTAVVSIADLHERAAVAVLGPVGQGVPTLTWPDLTVQQWAALVPSALALTLVTTAEGLLVARTYAQRRGYDTDSNRDLIAFGTANVAAGLTGGFTVGSSTSRTAAMDAVGSRTQLPSIVAAVGTLALLAFGTGLLEQIPSPAIGAIVAVAVVPLLGWGELAQLWRLDRFEFAIGALCFLTTLLAGAIPGILLAFVASLVNLARRSSRPAVDVLSAEGDRQRSLLLSAPAGSITAPEILLIRVAAPLFFANSTTVADAVRTAVQHAHEPVHHLVLDCEAVTDIDVTAAETLSGLKTWLQERHITVGFSRARPELLNRLQDLGLWSGEQTYATNRDAIAALTANTGPTVADSPKTGDT